jgi:hypothetical protein
MTDAIVSKRAASSVASLRPPGYLDALRKAASRETENHFVIPQEQYNALCAAFRSYKFKPPVPIVTSGPGTELKKLLKLVGITASPTCSCNARARTMDTNGCDWCEANIDTIVAELVRNPHRPLSARLIP